MNTQSPYLLCAACLGLRDWAEDPVVRAKGRQNRECHDSEDERVRAKTHRCVGRVGQRRCMQAINPLMRLCRACADRDRHCQHCQKPLSTVAAAAPIVLDEPYERLLDLVTLMMKTYGLSVARELVAANAELLGAELAARFIAIDDAHPTLTMTLLDERTKRPIWTKVLGQNVKRPTRCEGCPSPKRMAPALVRAVQCKHVTVGHIAEWCPVCATEMNVCEICGASSG